MHVSLTPEGRKLAEDFYAETCRRIHLLPATVDPAERETLADLLGRIVVDNEVPVVFMT
ncbi:hypothetical protein [Saccharothrix sp.]|uniref:hypothetical protein n=1 Tax=Saccharothrix sp. TaxID=1873460 RepID=UPI002810C1D9|nr:hypothetical protein [Saccharothrix sp.]